MISIRPDSDGTASEVEATGAGSSVAIVTGSSEIAGGAGSLDTGATGLPSKN